MIQIAQDVGFWLFLAALMALVGQIVRTVLTLVWNQGAIGEEVDSMEALIASVSTVISWLKLLKSNRLATVCALAILFLLWGSTEVGALASLGFSVLSYFISGLLTPMFMLRLKPIAASNNSQVISPEQSSDS